MPLNLGEDRGSFAVPDTLQMLKLALRNQGLEKFKELERKNLVSYDFSQLPDAELGRLQGMGISGGFNPFEIRGEGFRDVRNPWNRALRAETAARFAPENGPNNFLWNILYGIVGNDPHSRLQNTLTWNVLTNKPDTIGGEPIGAINQPTNMFGERINSALNGLVGGTGVARAPQISVPIGGTNTASINKTFDDINAGLQGAETDRRNQQAEHQRLATQYQNERQAMRDLPPPRIEPLNMFYGMLAANVGKVLNPNLNTEQQFQSLVTNKLNALNQDRLMDYQDKAQQYSEASALANKAGDAAEAIRLARLGDVAMQRANAILQDQQMAQQRAAATAERLALQRETIGEKAFSLRFKSINDQMEYYLKIDPNLKDKKNKTAYQRLVNQRNAMQDALDKSGNSFANIRLDPHFATRQLLQSVDLGRVTNPALFWQQSGLNDRRLREAGVTRADVVKFLRENGINEVR